MAFIANFLWGSATPTIKTGYRLLNIASGDTASILLFAGMRFFLAGVMVVLVGSAVCRRPLIPKKNSWKKILLLSLVQTVLQYLFFYIGVAHASGVKSAIICATNSFFSLLVAALVFRFEKLKADRVLGCAVGFFGVILINVVGAKDTAGISLLGEGFVVCSSLSYAFSSCMVKKYAGGEDPLTLSGWQFVAGGLVLMLIGYATGGRISGWTPVSVLVLIYLGFISAMAYSLWSILLANNPVSRISVFGLLTPVCGVFLSAIILNEKEQAFTLTGLLSLLLVCAGIYIVNRVPKQSGK